MPKVNHGENKQDKQATKQSIVNIFPGEINLEKDDPTAC